MKQIYFLFYFLLSYIIGNSQNYFIDFSGSGASTSVDQIQIKNLTQNTSLTINGNDVLHLTDVVKIEESGVFNSYLHVFSNPSSSNVLFELTNYQASPLEINLFDLSGKQIATLNQFIIEGIYQFQLEGLPTEFCILNVKTNQICESHKIISYNLDQHSPRISQINQKPLNTHFKETKATIDMQYNEGDVLMITGVSGEYSSVFMLNPSITTTIIFEFIPCKDGDNNTYPVVKIGSQYWMGKNLNSTHFVNGTSIDHIPDSLTWFNSTNPAYCIFNNALQPIQNYGLLYNWYVAQNPYICPLGWHVPTDIEWTQLYDEIGGYYSGGDLRATEDIYWDQPNSFATNKTGFTALPAGFRYPDFRGLGIILDCWCRNEYSISEAWMRRLTNNFSYDYNVTVMKYKGSSIRCVKD